MKVGCYFLQIAGVLP